MSEPRIVTPQEAQILAAAAMSGPWYAHAQGVSNDPGSTWLGTVLGAPYEEADWHEPSEPLVLAAPDLAHTVATEPDRTRAAVVKALRSAAGRCRSVYEADDIFKRATAIENGADYA